MHESEVENVASQSEEPKPSVAPEGVAERRAWHRWFLRIAAAIAISLLLLVAIEIFLRAFNVGYPTDLTQPCTIHGQPAACYNLFFLNLPPGMIKTPKAYAIPATKPASTFRIFVLGESAAMGDPDPAYGFSRYLNVMRGSNSHS